MDLTSKQPVARQLRWRKVDTPAEPGDLLDALADEPLAAMLDSSAVDGKFGRYSIVACRPADVVTLRDNRLTDRQGRPVSGNSPLESLRNALGAVTCTGQCPAPYRPGWIGYIGYEFGRCLENLPGRAVRDTSLPDVHLAFYDAVAVHDAIEKQWRLVWLDPPGEDSAALKALRKILRSSSPRRETSDEAGSAADPSAHKAVQYSSNFTPDEYRRTIGRCVDYIAAGDIFQVNLSQRLTVTDAPSPPAIYKSLRRRNPAWYSAYLDIGGPAVLSSSPELFLSLRSGRVLTRPIKGTRPRVGDRIIDAAAADELIASEKDNAELAMIVDLMRNDIGRLCRFGSVRADRRFVLETHPTVLHLVGSVSGLLRRGATAADLLAATFPGGSVTGAPKIRAMEIIDELEPIARGPYTGAIGWFGVNGDAELNIVIRTIVWDAAAAHVQVGGAIVADSTPDGEYRETLDKARALLEAIASAR